MIRNVFRTILVIGENHEEIVKKYSLDTKVERYLKMKFDDAEKLRNKHLEFIEKIMTNKQVVLSDRQREIYKSLYLDIKEMDDFDYFQKMTEGCYYDETTGDAYSTVNPNAYYQYERCPQKRLDATDEESDFSNPFILKDETISYVAKVGDIDWSRMHMYRTDIYKAAWELVVEDREPVNDEEKRIKENMKNRLSYFDNFENKEEYIIYSCSFWTYGVATNDGYKELDFKISDKEWVKNFYDTFIKTLNKDETIALYEVKRVE